MATNEPTLALYRKASWTELGRYPDEFHVRGRSIGDVLMGKRLADTLASDAKL